MKPPLNEGNALADGNLLLRFEGSVAKLTLNRPDRYNALDAGMAAGLLQAARQVAANESIRVLVVIGAGRGFCAGGDVAFVASHFPNVEGAIRGFLSDFHEFLQTVRTMPQIVLTAVHGSAAGAGMSLALMGDLCVAADNARFVPAYAKLGVSPDCGGSLGVPMAIGVRRAMQLYLCEQELSAARALDWGLVNEVVPAAAFECSTRDRAAQLAAIPSVAARETKALLNRPGPPDLRAQLDAELQALLRCTDTDAYRAAVRSFLDSSQ
jgi:enoyl-CoA hydratase/carnithine racemase